MTLSEVIDEIGTREPTLTVVNRDEPEPVVRMLKRMVDAPDVTVREAEPPECGPANFVLLEGDADEQRLAVSTIADVGDSVLMVNSDLYVTGTRSLDEVDTPDVLAGLHGTTFTVAGKQKMLLIELSRHVEALAHRSAGSTIHAGFQSLSRIDDERGTRRVYERLVEAGVDVHLYGVPDAVPDLPGDAHVHANDAEEIRRTWFVVNADCPPDVKAALVAEESGPNEWTGVWMFDPETVDRIAAYLAETYHR
ncbi:DICT sensory domain-containing protein [Halomicrobium urmianum]|uniref:DICT sensory domain-containing protein n=1 Tax=Halomicrobium urmianum TaxID=1586233 RepID=UPI001CD9AA3A|nr:DICT sensory domain-containing protein [Halomicrobium urmianum]